ncbi:MAG: GntR family transcriptional regulator [Planctomycetota bacterium]
MARTPHTFRPKIATGSDTPIYRQIVDQVRLAVANGQLPPGAAMPSVRALAERLVVNPNTVAKAYSRLTGEGVLVSQAGRGVFVGEARAVYSDGEAERRLDLALDAVVNTMVELRLKPDQVVKRFRQRLDAHGLSKTPKKKGASK